ncbi:MAG TPA: hypothetical protein VLL25_05470 [Acidimicrobiales bacterium]|nr:hypothetical protein [Acidimicrobiales bacterium]
MRMRTEATAVGIALSCLCLGLVACGSGSSNGGAGSLRDAMGAVKDSPESRTSFAWADQKALRTLTGVSAASSTKRGDPKWVRLNSVAVPAAADVGPQLADGTGIDVRAGQRAISIGVLPSGGERLDGVNGTNISKKLKGLGATQESALGRLFLTFAAENRVDLSNAKLGDDVFLVLNRAVVKGSSVAFGLANGAVDAILGGGRSLADVAGESAIADCLGDTVAAQVMAPPAGVASGVSLVGVGVRRPQLAKSSAREVLCEVVDKQSASALAATVRDRVRPDSRLFDGYEVRDRIAQASVDQITKGDTSLIRLTLDLVAPARAGFLFFDQGPDRQGLAFLGGGSTANGAPTAS